MIEKYAHNLSYDMITRIFRYNSNSEEDYYYNKLRKFTIGKLIQSSGLNINEKITLKFQFIDGYWLGRSFISNIRDFISSKPLMSEFGYEKFEMDEAIPNDCVFGLKWRDDKNNEEMYLLLSQNERIIRIVVIMHSSLINEVSLFNVQFQLLGKKIHVILKSEAVPEYEIKESFREYDYDFKYFETSEYTFDYDEHYDYDFKHPIPKLTYRNYQEDHFDDLNTEIAKWLRITDGYEEKFDFIYVYVENMYKLPPIKLLMSSELSVEISDEEISISRYENSNSIPANFFGKNINSVHALIGKNGSGKSSLIQLLSQCEIFNKQPMRNLGNLKYFIIYKIGRHYYFVNQTERRINCKNIIFKKSILKSTNICLISNVYDFSCYEELVDDKNESRSHLERNMTEARVNNNTNLIDLTTNGQFIKLMRDIKSIDDKQKDSSNEKEPKVDEQKKNFDKDESQNQGSVKSLLKIIMDDLYHDDVMYVNMLLSHHELLEKIEGFDFIDKPITKLSSGEQARLIIFSRLFSLFNEHFFPQKENCIIFFDEAELYMHPEWQRTLINDILVFLNTVNSYYKSYKNMTLYFSSNSPFLMSDLPSSNIHMFGNIKEASLDNTFGKNIYSLLKDEFFMQGGVIGKFAQEKINTAFSACDNDSMSEEERNYICNILGDKLIKNLLKRRIQQNVSD